MQIKIWGHLKIAKFCVIILADFFLESTNSSAETIIRELLVKLKTYLRALQKAKTLTCALVY